jgi:hypothetical protein
MNRLTADQRAKVLHMLCEGNSIRSITRVLGVGKNTVIRLLADAGKACMEYHDVNVRNVACNRIEVDEIWSFTYALMTVILEAEPHRTYTKTEVRCN